MSRGSILLFIMALVIISLLVFYWFIPFGTVEFTTEPINSNFSLNGVDKNMQFYPNMRFPESKISYRILNCPLQKEADMKGAFDILSNQTELEFYSVADREEIFVTCDSKERVEEGLFIAGEGGPTNITKTSNFNVILNGKVLLIKKSECPKPNVAIHELLHVLGFEHSSNKNNIMFNISKCSHTIGDDTINLINKLYETPSHSDLSFENVSASTHGKYLDTNISIRNNGLKDSQEFKIVIYADDKNIKEIEIDSLLIGYGRIITLQNVWVKQLSVKEIKIVIDAIEPELDKQNNEVVLVVG